MSSSLATIFALLSLMPLLITARLCRYSVPHLVLLYRIVLRRAESM